MERRSRRTIGKRAEAAKFVGSMRYAPVGCRSSEPIRASLYGGSDYHAKANDSVVAFGMIKTQEVLDNLDQILSMKGLDAVYIGPSPRRGSRGPAPAPPVSRGDLQTDADACRLARMSGLRGGQAEANAARWWSLSGL